MILSPKEIMVLNSPKKIKLKQRSILRSRARNELIKLGSKTFHKELEVIAKHLDSGELLIILDILCNRLPLSMARQYLKQKLDFLDKKSDPKFYSLGLKWRNLARDADYVSKKIGTKEKLTSKEAFEFIYLNKASRIAKIKKKYLQDKSFVLDRKIQPDKELIKSRPFMQKVLKKAIRLKKFNVRILEEKLFANAKMKKRFAFHEIVKTFVGLGIFLKQELNEEKFIEDVRKKILSDDFKVETISRFTKKVTIYPYNATLNKQQEFKVNSYYV